MSDQSKFIVCVCVATFVFRTIYVWLQDRRELREYRQWVDSGCPDEE